MDALERLLNEYSAGTIIMVVVLVFVACEWLVTKIKKVVDWFKKRKKDYHAEETAKDAREDEINNRLDALEKADQKQIDAFKDISKNISEMQASIKQMQKDQKKMAVASCRSTLYRIASEIEDRDYITQIEYETFNELADIYIANEGNHTMKDKIIPMIRNKQIRG